MSTSSTDRATSAPQASLASLAQLLTLRTIEQMKRNGKLEPDLAALLQKQYTSAGSTR